MEVLESLCFSWLIKTFSGTEIQKPFVGLQHLVEVDLLYYTITHTYKSLKTEKEIL
jgi:hypothetical protein